MSPLCLSGSRFRTLEPQWVPPWPPKRSTSESAKAKEVGKALWRQYRKKLGNRPFLMKIIMNCTVITGIFTEGCCKPTDLV
jgi:hypothetical protein